MREEEDPWQGGVKSNYCQITVYSITTLFLSARLDPSFSSGKCLLRGKRDVIEPLCKPEWRTFPGGVGSRWENPPKMIGCPGVAAFVFQPNAISAAFAQTKENSEWREGGRKREGK